ncbi:MAG: SPOR domain-containing protein [Sodalis sp. (in: enterobacteria)]
MIQRDYVGRGESSSIKRKTTNSKKNRSSLGKSKTIIVLVAAILIIFISDLYFIAHNKSEDTVIMPNHSKNTENGLPPKPEERWRYIKELENHQISAQSSIKNIVGNDKVDSLAQLNNKKQKLLEQMREDIRQEAIHLKKALYNNRSKTIGAAQIPPTTIATIEKPHQYWLAQCGSFKTIDQAELVRAQLAFVGIESHISTGNGWNRVLLGPYSSRSDAHKILQNLCASGISNYIPISDGG